MKKSFKNILSAAALLMLTATSAFADGDDKGVVANKKVTPNEDGTYTLTLEAYATGSSVTTVTEESVPLDIVLVLDVSGSMKDPFEIYTGEKDRTKTYYRKTGLETFNEVKYRNNKWQTFLGVGGFGTWIDLPSNVDVYSDLTKIQALKNACNLFIESVAKESNDDCTHNISIVTFSDNSTIVKSLTSSHKNKSALEGAINQLTASGATGVDQGMTNAKSVIDGIPDERKLKSNKLVVMFTDGKPTTRTSFSETVANNAVATAKELKGGSVLVYSVGIFDSEDDEIAKTYQYMSAVSSDSPSAEEYTDGGTSTGKFFMTAADSDELDNIFSSISKTATEGSTTSTLTATNSSVRDFVTPEFKIVGTAENIELEVYPSDATNKTAEPKWLAAQPATGVTAAIGAADEDGNTPVIVTGFDYSANWVGPDKTGTTINGWRPEGKKLVIKIKIKLDKNSGGVIQTNTKDSGIYSGEGQEATFESIGIEFPVPQAVSKGKAVLVIQKPSLSDGESAIFDIYADGELINTVMVNESTKRKAEVLVDWLIPDAPAAITVAELVDYMIPFSVVERTNWTWNTPDTVEPKTLYKVEGRGDNARATANVFVFDAGESSTKSSVAHDEESVVIKK